MDILLLLIFIRHVGKRSSLLTRVFLGILKEHCGVLEKKLKLSVLIFTILTM